MPKYIVTKTYKTTEEVEVWADSESDAKEVAKNEGGAEIDCWLFDMTVEEIKE